MTKRPKIQNVIEKVRACVNSGRYLDTYHSNFRGAGRGITRSEIIYVLKNGYHERAKDEYKIAYKDWNYAIRGKSVDNRPIRIAVAFEEATGMLIITAIDLSK